MKRITPITLAAATFLFALALATPAEAHGRRDQRHGVEHRYHRQQTHHRQFDRYDHRAYRHDRSFRHHRFDIPQRLHDDRHHVYRPYYEGAVYFAPHHHRHAIYRFPVTVGRGPVFREHFYCDGELFLDHGRLDYHGHRFSISLGF